MRVAQVAPLAESVPPRLYGGTERVVSWLTEELVGMGCDVTLFASGDSATKAALVPVCSRALRLTRPSPDPYAAYATQLEALASKADEFDVIHCHLDWIHLPLLSRLGVPFLTTLHGRLDLPHAVPAGRGFDGAPFVSISQNQREPLPQLNWLETVHHGLPCELHRPCFRPEGYLAFLGRIAPEKGPDVAIRVAHGVGMPLRVAAKIPRAGSRYFSERIEPLIDGRQVEFVGEVGDEEKTGFLGRATALLFPIDWPEPFGLVMIEAMACGTPVVAWRRGSVPEIVEHGVTGFVVDTEAEAIEAVRQIGKLDRRRVREAFELRFAARRMAADYVRCYEALARASRHMRASRAAAGPLAAADRRNPLLPG